MFSFLNPFLLWLAPLLAGPLLIHFLGRAEPKTRDFPSLLPVRGQLVRAMRRHRLRNWLQLVLRTLILLCLLLAAAHLVWRSPARWAPPETTGLLLHNGAYAAVPDAEGNLGGGQARLRRGLDSLTPGRAFTELLLPEAPAGRPVARFGRYPEAVARLLQKTGRAPGTAHVFLPVFDARDLQGLVPVVKPWLTQHPEARLVLIDYAQGGGRAQSHLSPFSQLRAGFEKEGQVALRVSTALAQAPLWISANGAARETRLENGVAEILLPLPESGDIAGAFAPAAADAGSRRFAESLATVSLRVPPPATACLAAPPASAWMARATLGEGGKRLEIRTLRAAADTGSACDRLYLADPENLDAALLARAAAALRAGGKVIVGVGGHTDAALLNRNLLVPLGVGRLTALEQHGSRAARAEAKSLARLGLRADAWGRPGAVRRHLGFQPEPGTTVLLSLRDGNANAPLLAHHRLPRGGEILVWTTDIADPAWSDLALNPWTALLHTAFFSGATGENAEPAFRSVDSDSTLFLAMPGTLNGEGAEDGDVTLRDPEGRVSPRWLPEPGGGRAGPFDRTGLYSLESPRDTARFAVNLAETRLRPQSADDAEAAWKDFHAGLGQADGQVGRLDAADGAGPDWSSLYGGFNLRFALLILAALLLFAEGVVSLRLSPFRN